MINTNSEEGGLAKALERANRASYLKTYIKEPLEEIITTLRGNTIDVLLLLIFTHLDLLGCLYSGNTSSRNSSRNAVAFIREYLGSIDKRYKEIGGLLYCSLRHGLVHLVTPKRILLQNGMILDFSFALAGKREENFRVFKAMEIQRTGRRVNIYRLSLNLSLLYQDLLSAIDLYAKDMCHNQVLSDTFWKVFETRRAPEKMKEDELLKRQYIQQSDFDFVRAQISNL